GEDGTVALWDLGTGAEELVLRGHIKPVRRLAFSGDSKRLAAADSPPLLIVPELKCWDLDAGALMRPRRGPAGHFAFCLALHPDTSRFLVISEDALVKPSQTYLSLHDLDRDRVVWRTKPT